MWLPPRYHGQVNDHGEEYNSYAFTHGDRVRISPIEGCSMTCKFCDLPYSFKYRTKRIEGLIESVRVAINDPLQPAAHVLISGGTPRDVDVAYVRDVYAATIGLLPRVPVDIMMVPIDGLMDPTWLDSIGVNEVSVNVEIFDRPLAHDLMRRKAAPGLETYLGYLERASAVMGPHRVRSMLMVGLEPMEATLAGVEAIAARGAVPVLSPFRPDPATPLRHLRPATATEMTETYLRAFDICSAYGTSLGPRCVPCTHNTLTLAKSGHATEHYGHPNLI
jgi:hypothetical protein